MANYVILHPDSRIFPGEKKKHASGRHTSQKVQIIHDSAIFERVGEMIIDNQPYVHLRLVYGDLKVWQRSERNWDRVTSPDFYLYVPIDVELEEVQHGELVERTAKDWKTWRNERVIIDKYGKNVVTRIDKIDLGKTLETGEVFARTSEEISFKLSEAIYIKETSPAETMALAKEMAKSYGLTTTNDEDILEDDHDPEFNILRFDFYRNLSGQICIPERNYVQFQKDLIKLAEKYHVPLNEGDIVLDPVEDLHNFSIDSEEMQLHFHNKGVKVEEIFHQRRGQITGTKFGI